MLQVAVIGLGRFGRGVSYSLVELGAEVLAIDSDPAATQNIADHVARAVSLDATDKRALTHVGVPDMDTAVVAIGEPMETSIFVTSVLAELEVPQIVARARRPLHARILQKVGADRVCYLEQDMGAHIAKSLMGQHVVDWFTVADGLEVAHLVVAPPIAGKSLLDLHFRRNYGLMVVGHEKSGSVGSVRGAMALPDPNDPMQAGDHIAVAGPHDAIDKLQKLMGESHRS
ncbi:MAG: TrkA family potassium uptake protein [Armatimonadia bacterium]|nr:TrkA family potassium uptake protein [Armatimonadia bacterium]